MKPTKSDQKHDQGKHRGQDKHDANPTDESEDQTDHERKQNHGWFVSQVAKDHSLTGRAHGEAVSDVAQSDVGKTQGEGD